MRTTLTVDDDIMDFLKEQARLQGRPFKKIVNDALRRGMSPAVQEERPVFRVKPIYSGFRPGVDLLKLNQLNDELEVEEYFRKSRKSGAE